jgi:hypothetical protein
MAFWHGLAKLRMHTDLTLTILDTATTALGGELRNFATTTCAAFNTMELRREVAARIRRTVSREKNQTGSRAQSSHDSDAKMHGQLRSSARSKKFNMNTYKIHALGDYVDTIRRLGTTDSYSTEVVSHFCFPIYSLYQSTVRASGSIAHAKQDTPVQAGKILLSRWQGWSGGRLAFVAFESGWENPGRPLNMNLKEHVLPTCTTTSENLNTTHCILASLYKSTMETLQSKYVESPWRYNGTLVNQAVWILCRILYLS